MIQILEFNLIFPEETPKDLSVYLTGIDKTTLLKLAGHLTRTSTSQDYYFDNAKVISDWFHRDNSKFANALYHKILQLERDLRSKICILNISSSLSFFELVVTSSINPEPKQTNLELEINIFKLYLLLNSRLSLKDRMISSSTSNLDSKCKLEGMYFANSIYNTDLLNYNPTKILISQFIKAYLLFEVLSSNTEYIKLLQKFLGFYKCEDWSHYLRKVLPFTSNNLKAKQTGYLSINLYRDKDFEDNIEFLDKFSISSTLGINDPIDFKTLRNTPIYELEKGSYLVVSDLFLNEKLFKGLYFKLNELNDDLPKSDKIADFKSIYCDQISEKKILYSTLDKAFKDRYLKLNGSQIKSFGIIGEPDYYIRDRNKILLFESKDILIPAEIKTSGDFKKLRLTFRDKLYFSIDKPKKRIKQKAVIQIISVIERLLKKQDFIKFDKELETKSLNIYPILVLHDNLYNAAGLNKLINFWFQKELNKLSKNGLNISKIRPITIIDIDTLIFNKEAINNFKGSFSYFIDDYHCNFLKINFKKARTDKERNSIIENSMMPFSIFFDKHPLIKKYWTIPKEFEEYARGIIKDDFPKNNSKVD